MLKLTHYHNGRKCFVNPRLITDIVERQVRDRDLDTPTGPGSVKAGYRVEGCLICFGGPEDSGVAVIESAEHVAAAAAAYNEPGAGWGITDVADGVRLIAEEMRNAPCKDCGKVGLDCECIPF
jgi:hypothetical protein